MRLLFGEEAQVHRVPIRRPRARRRPHLRFYLAARQDGQPGQRHGRRARHRPSVARRHVRQGGREVVVHIDPAAGLQREAPRGHDGNERRIGGARPRDQHVAHHAREDRPARVVVVRKRRGEDAGVVDQVAKDRDVGAVVPDQQVVILRARGPQGLRNDRVADGDIVQGVPRAHVLVRVPTQRHVIDHHIVGRRRLILDLDAIARAERGRRHQIPNPDAEVLDEHVVRLDLQPRVAQRDARTRRRLARHRQVGTRDVDVVREVDHPADLEDHRPRPRRLQRRP